MYKICSWSDCRPEINLSEVLWHGGTLSVVELSTIKVVRIYTNVHSDVLDSNGGVLILELQTMVPLAGRR